MTSRFIPMPVERNFARPNLPRQAGKKLNRMPKRDGVRQHIHGVPPLIMRKHLVLIKMNMRRSALRFLPDGKNQEATPIPSVYDRLIGKWGGRLRSGSLQGSTE